MWLILEGRCRRQLEAAWRKSWMHSRRQSQTQAQETEEKRTRETSKLRCEK
ncbi:MAG: hypothetical protein ACI8RD_009298 [Bacillariaceae sp.]|jgi:hypothetical protein